MASAPSAVCQTVRPSRSSACSEPSAPPTYTRVPSGERAAQGPRRPPSPWTLYCQRVAGVPVTDPAPAAPATVSPFAEPSEESRSHSHPPTPPAATTPAPPTAARSSRRRDGGAGVGETWVAAGTSVTVTGATYSTRLSRSPES